MTNDFDPTMINSAHMANSAQAAQELSKMTASERKDRIDLMNTSSAQAFHELSQKKASTRKGPASTTMANDTDSPTGGNAGASSRKSPTSINIDARTASMLDARRSYGETRTARLEADLTAYHALLINGLRRARMVLTPAEASLVLDGFYSNSSHFEFYRSRDVLNYSPMNILSGGGQPWTADRLAARISEAMTLDGLADKWGVDGEALLAKLSTIGDIVSVALVDWVETVSAQENFDIAVEAAIFKGA